MIQTQGLTKNFGLLRAVENLDLDVSQGEFFAFLGPNGAGKTTSIKMLTGLLKPSSGWARVAGYDIQQHPTAAKRLISYVPDFPFLYDKLTPREFLRFVGELYEMRKTDIILRTGELFDQFHLNEYHNELIENLSHGTRQRVAISAGLLHDPRVLIIDEPMVGLDPMHARIVKDEFKARSRAGCTVFLSTHQLSVAEELADRIGIINHGRLIALGTVDELRAENAGAEGALEKIFLSLIDAEEKHREAVAAADARRPAAAMSEVVMPAPGTWATLRALTPEQRNAAIASYLGWTLDAFDFFILVMVVRHVAHDFHTTREAVTYAIFLTLAMRPLGALAFGLLADRYGRRPTLMFNIAFFSVMELLSGFAPSLGWFLALRALYGFGMGGEWGVGASLVMETIPPGARGVVSGILQEGYPVGYLLAAVVYKCVFPLGGWRWMFFVGFLPALLVLYIRGSVRESPAWQQADAARRVALVAGEKRRLWPAVKAHWKMFLFLILLMTAFNFCSHGTQDLYPSLFLEGQRGFSEQTAGTIVIIYNLGALCGGILVGAWSQSIGRRRAIIVAALCALPIIPLWAYASSPVTIAAGAFLMQFVIQGAWGVVPVHLNELSPAAVRGTFPGLAYQLGNLLAACNAPLQNRIAAAHGHDYRLALAIVVGCGACAVATVAFFGPEAKSVDLVEKTDTMDHDFVPT